MFHFHFLLFVRHSDAVLFADIPEVVEAVLLDWEQSLFFFRFSKESARARERRSRETRETREAAREEKERLPA